MIEKRMKSFLISRWYTISLSEIQLQMTKPLEKADANGNINAVENMRIISPPTTISKKKASENKSI